MTIKWPNINEDERWIGRKMREKMEEDLRRLKEKVRKKYEKKNLNKPN